MPSQEMTPTRRAMLGFLAAAPLAVTIPLAAATANTRDFDAAVATFEQARRIEQRFAEGMKDGYDKSKDERHSALCDERYDRERAVYLTPAPTMAALAHKLELFGEEQAWEYHYIDEIAAALLADARRLGSN